MAKPYKRAGSRFWWIAPTINGMQVRQSSGETDYDRAFNKLKILEGKLASGAPIQPKTDRDSFAALLELVRTDYKIKRRRSLYDLEKRLDLQLIPIVGRYPAGRISSAIIGEYILERQSAGAANASINRELAIIKRAFHLGIDSGAVSHKPKIEMLPEENVRQGFFNEDHFRSVLGFANPLLKDVLILAYYTGWRIESVLALEWQNVDVTRGVIGLRANQTKNRKATTFPLEPFPELIACMERRKATTKGLITPWVFHRDGARVKSIRTAWLYAREKANVPGRLIHDLRRTAVRNLKASGWSDTEVMNMVGLKTFSMLLRYNITTEDDILRKAKAIAAAQRM